MGNNNDDVWHGFADMLGELFLKYGSALLEEEEKADEAESHGQDVDGSDATVSPPSERGFHDSKYSRLTTLLLM